jgi:diketogulonate reductase-like aldo/keto reductase
MRRVELGTTGVLLPEFGLGTYLYTGGPEPLTVGLDLGSTLIDTAPLYLSESVVGEAVRGRRNEVFVATKVGGHQAHYPDIMAACERSLRALGTDWIDLYQLHWPNPDVPIAETVGALEELVDAGKVRFLGLSNFSVPEIRAAQAAASRHRFVSNQIQYSLVQRGAEVSYNPNGLADPSEGDVIAYCRAEGLTVVAWGPLGVGRLLNAEDDRSPAQLLRSIAEEVGGTPAQVALNWCTSGGGVIAIPKSNSAAHIANNLAAAEWILSPDHVAKLDAAFDKYRGAGAVPGRLCDYLAQWANEVETTGEQR